MFTQAQVILFILSLLILFGGLFFLKQKSKFKFNDPMYKDYIKIKCTIESCETLYQLTIAEKMFKRFCKKYFIYNDNKFHKLADSLRETLIRTQERIVKDG